MSIFCRSRKTFPRGDVSCSPARALAVRFVCAGFLALFGGCSDRQADLHASLQQRILESELGSAVPVHFAKTPEAPIPSSDSLGTVLSGLNSPSPQRRWSAADELVLRADPRTVEFLVEAMLDPAGTVRVCVMASALGHLKDPRALGPLTTAAFDPANRDLRLCAIQSLGMIGDPKAVPTLIRALKERNMPIAAANALAQLDDERAVAALVEAARDPELRLWMVNALGELGRPAARPYLIDEAAADADPAIREAAVEAVWKISVLSDGARQSALDEVLMTDPSAAHRAWAAFKVGELRLAGAAPTLVAGVNDRESEVRERSAAALVRIGEPAADVVRRALQQEPVNRYLIAVLGYIGSSDDLALLRQLQTSTSGAAATVAATSARMLERRRAASESGSVERQTRRWRSAEK
jgi:HEAT repeat protein